MFPQPDIAVNSLLALIGNEMNMIGGYYDCATFTFYFINERGIHLSVIDLRSYLINTDYYWLLQALCSYPLKNLIHKNIGYYDPIYLGA